MTTDWKRPKKGRFEYRKSRDGTEIRYDPPASKIVGRCPLDGTPLYAAGLKTIFCKDHKWIRQESTVFKTGQIIGRSPTGEPLMISGNNLYDKLGYWWRRE